MRQIALFLIAFLLFLDASEPFKPYRITNFDSRSTKNDVKLCAILNRYVMKSNTQEIKKYIKVIPKSDYLIEASYYRICITNLKPKTKYRVTFAKELPLGKQHLDKEYTFTKETKDLRPSFRFKESGYIIPAKGEISIPLESINVDRVAINLYRINQNNLMHSINMYDLRSSLEKYELNEIQDELGFLLWQKRLKINMQPNKKVVTAIPIGSALKKREPGIYIVAVAPIHNNKPYWYNTKTAWFLISDIGIYAQKGVDRLHIYTKHLSSASSYDKVTLKLISKNNEVLATTTTKGGYALFKSSLLNGKDALKARAIYAYGEGDDFTVLDLNKGALDLSSRGDSGRLQPSSYDAFIFSNRGIFKPKESIEFHLIVNNQNGKRAPNLALSAHLINPQEKVVAQQKITTDSFGHAQSKFVLPNKSGSYTILLYAGSKEPIGKLTFLVEDFIPPKIEVTLKKRPTLLKPFREQNITIEANYLTGEALANPKVDYSVVVVSRKDILKEFKGYHFGRVNSGHFREFIYDSSGVGDSKGVVELPILIDRKFNTSLPLVALVKVHVLEPGGRGVESYFTIPFANQEGFIGIKPKFENDAINLNQKAVFELIYLKNFKVASKELKWRLILEEPHWNWRTNDNNDWEYYVTYEDIKVISQGNITIKPHPTLLNLPKLSWGSYRLEVTSSDGAVSSYRFSSGYDGSASKVSPDRLPIKLNKQQFLAGEQLEAYIRPKFSGPILVQLASSKILATKQLIAHANKPLKVAFKLKKEFPSSLYLLATAFRAQSSKHGANRAVGLAHVSIINPINRINLELSHKKEIESQSILDIKVHAKEASQKEVKLTLALVDKGVLNLTKYKEPNPYSYFFGKKRLGVKLYDIYSELIKPSGEHAAFDVGADSSEDERINSSITNRRKVIAKFSKIVSLKNGKDANVSFKIPNYQGALSLIAVAWSKEGVGSAKSKVIVKDPISIELYMPRFLALNDSAKILAHVRFDNNITGVYTLKAKGKNVSLMPKESLLDATKQKEFKIPLKIKATKLADANITLEVVNSSGFEKSRSFMLATRMPTVKSYIKSVGLIEANSTIDFKDLIDKSYSGIDKLTLKISSRPLLATTLYKKALKEYCCRCGEQTTSRGFAFLDDIKNRDIVLKSIQRLYELQKYDGGFSLWEGSKSSLWVSSYILDFLTKAKEKGFEVSSKRINSGLRYLQQNLKRWSKDAKRLDANLYALYVLARNKIIVYSDINYHKKSAKSTIKSASSLAYLAATLNLIGQKEAAKELFNQANSYLNSNNYSNFGSYLRDSALVALLKYKSNLIKDAQELFENVALEAKKRKYLSTQEMSMLIRTAKAIDIPSSPLSIAVNNKEFLGKEYLKRVNGIANLPKVKNLQKTAIWYQLTYSGSLNPKDINASSNRGFSIQKELFLLNGKRVDLKNIPHAKRIVVVLSGKIEDSTIKHPLIVDLLPSGFELENPNISGYDETNALSWLKDKSQTLKQYYRDDRYIAALNSSNKEFKVAYIARAVTKGEFALPPALIEAMYKPYYRALSINRSFKISIKDPKEIKSTKKSKTDTKEQNGSIAKELTTQDYNVAFSAPLGDLKGYSTLDLYYLRNAIFAWVGLDFSNSNPMLYRHYLKFSWYKPIIKSPSRAYSMLNSIQRTNVHRLLNEEKSRLGGLSLANFYKVRSKELTLEDLKGYSKEQLQILRNSLLATYGYKFKDSSLLKIYKQLPWYKVDAKIDTATIIDKLMTPLQRKNLNTILEAEKQKIETR